MEILNLVYGCDEVFFIKLFIFRIMVDLEFEVKYFVDCLDIISSFFFLCIRLFGSSMKVLGGGGIWV